MLEKFQINLLKESFYLPLRKFSKFSNGVRKWLNASSQQPPRVQSFNCAQSIGCSDGQRLETKSSSWNWGEKQGFARHDQYNGTGCRTNEQEQLRLNEWIGRLSDFKYQPAVDFNTTIIFVFSLSLSVPG